MNAALMNPEWSRVDSMGYDGFEGRPFLVFWEITRSCALACKHCRAEAQPHRHPDELNREEASRLIQQLAELKPPMLILTGGDPLMRRDCLDLVREASAAGLHVGLSPSATERLLHANFGEIKAAGVDRISLSLDGASRETHDAFRGIPGTFTRTIAAVHRAHAAGLRVQINTTLTRGNLREYEAFKQLMFELKPAMWSVFLLVPTGRAGTEAPDDVGHEIDLDAQLAGLVGEDQPRLIVRLRILLPVDEVDLGGDPQRIGQDARAGMRAGPQANHLRAKVDRAIVAVMRDVLQCDMNRHGVPPASQGDTCKGQDLCHHH